MTFARLLRFLLVVFGALIAVTSRAAIPMLMNGAADLASYNQTPWTLQKTGVYVPTPIAGVGAVNWSITVTRGETTGTLLVMGYFDLTNSTAAPVPLQNVVVNLQTKPALDWATVSSDVATAALGDAATQATVDPDVTWEGIALFTENAASGPLTLKNAALNPVTLDGPGISVPAQQTLRLFFVASYNGTMLNLAPGTPVQIEVIASFAPPFNMPSLSLQLPATVPVPTEANGTVHLLDNTVTPTGAVTIGPFTSLDQLLTVGGAFPLNVHVEGNQGGGTVCNTATLTSPDTPITLAAGGVTLPTFTVAGIDLSASNCQDIPPGGPRPITATIESCAQVVTYDGSLFTSPSGTIASASFTPASGSTFPFGTSTVAFVVTDSGGNTSTGTLYVHVLDTEAPVIAPVANITVPAEAGKCSATVTYATTATDCNLASLTFSPLSGSAFPVGTTPVTITATDTAGHTSTSTFNVTVQDTQPPAITSPLNDLTLQNDAGQCYATFNYEPKAVDNCGGAVTVSVSPASGSHFAAGTTTTVVVTATDSAGNSTVRTFTVTVATCLPPGMCLEKKASVTCAKPYQAVVYTYIVKNTGGTTLTNIVVTDDNGTPSYPGDDFTVGTIASLAPGATATLTAQVIPVVTMAATVNGSSINAGTVIVVVLPNGDLKVTYRQSFGVNDNTYGTGQIGWSGGKKFAQLVTSDHLEFRFLDRNNKVVLDFYADCVSAASSVTIPGSGQVVSFPSGYGAMGPFGGDGYMISGSANAIVSFTTSISDNLNQAANVPNKAALIVDSPTSLVAGNVVINTTKAPGGWDPINSYTVVVKGSVFGSAGFGAVSFPDLHNSPAKICVEQLCLKPACSTVTNTGKAVSGSLTAKDTATVTLSPSAAPSATGRIGSLVWIDKDGDGRQDAGEAGLGGVTVYLKNAYGIVIDTDVTDGTGEYQFDGLTAGNYTVVVGTPAGYTPSPKLVGTDRSIDSNGSPAAVTLATNSSSNQTIDFGFVPSSTCAKSWLTFTQGGWGAQPKGTNAAALLTKKWTLVYSSGYVGIGNSSRWLAFTSPDAVIKFLPQGGTPGMLGGSALNPSDSNAGVLAGQVLALRLNVDFSSAGQTASGLSWKRLSSGPLAGKTVGDVLTLANNAIAGGPLPYGVSLAGLNDVLTKINENYDDGGNNGYLQ